MVTLRDRFSDFWKNYEMKPVRFENHSLARRTLSHTIYCRGPCVGIECAIPASVRDTLSYGGLSLPKTRFALGPPIDTKDCSLLQNRTKKLRAEGGTRP